MKTLSMSRIPATEQRIAQLLASKLSCLYVLFATVPTIVQGIGNALNIRRYITLPELGELYRRMADECREELRPLLDQIATDFNGWLIFFKTYRFRLHGPEKAMVVEELIASAKAFAQKMILFSLDDIGDENKDRIMIAMKKEATGWEEISFLLNQEFNAALFHRALKLARGDKDRLLFLSRLKGISRHRLAYIYHCLLEDKNKLTYEDLYSMYKRLDRRSTIRPAILAIMDERPIPFPFWIRVYQIECREYEDDSIIAKQLGKKEIIRLSWNKISAIEITPEMLVNTCNNYRDERFNAMMAGRLQKMEFKDPLRWETLYELSAPSAPEIRGVILDKQLTIILNSSREELPVPQKMDCLRELFIKSINYPRLAKKSLGGMISLLPQRHGSLSPEETAIFGAIKNLLGRIKNNNSFRKLLRALAPKLDKEQWVDLFIQFRHSPVLRNHVFKEYKRSLIKDIIRRHPDMLQDMKTNKFRNQLRQEQAQEIAELKKNTALKRILIAA